MLPKCHDHPWRKKSLEIYQWIELTTGLWISLQFYKSTKDAIPLPSFLKFYFVSLFYFLSCLENPSRSKLYLFILTYEAKNNYSLLSTLTALWLHLSLTYHCVTVLILHIHKSSCELLDGKALHLFHILYSWRTPTYKLNLFLYLLTSLHFLTSLTKVYNK